MKPPKDFDQTALDVFTGEGAPPRQEPPRPDCVTTPGTMSGFNPRRMPMLRVACPSGDGMEQRYRKPLWRSFKPRTP
jgi:hypothetical protein